MSSNNRNTQGFSIGVLGLLTVALVTLKAAGLTTLSWWLVLLPLYGPALAALIVTILALAGVFIAALLKD